MTLPESVVFWPGTPLLVEGANPQPNAEMTRMRQACRSAIGRPDAIVMVAEGGKTRMHRGSSWGTLAGFGIDRTVGLRSGAVAAPAERRSTDLQLPPSLVATLLFLAESGAPPAVAAVEIDPDDASDAEDLVHGAIGSPETVVIAVGEGSARSTPSSPGRYTAEAARADERVLSAVRHGDPGELDAIEVSEDLQMSGVPAWHGVCSMLKGVKVDPAAEITHAAPFGVEYFVCRWTVDARDAGGRQDRGERD